MRSGPRDFCVGGVQPEGGLARFIVVKIIVTSFVALALAGALSGCTKEKGDASRSHAASAPALSTATDAPMSPRVLALAPTHGTAPVDRVITSLQRSASQSADRSEPFVLLGRAWVRKARETSDPGFYVNADACATIALEITPRDKLALDLRALVLLNEHRFDEARAVAQRVVDESPEDPMAYGNLSDALLELGLFGDAARAAQAMMDLKPNLPSYSRAAYFRWLEGDAAGAKHSMRLALDAGRDAKDVEPRAWTLVQAAMIFWHEGDYDGAEAGFEKALDAMPDYPPALVGQGRVALARSDANRAIDRLEKAYASSPLAETAWLLGDARGMAGDAAGAEAAYARVVDAGRRGDKRTLSLFESTKSRAPAEALALAEAEKTGRGDLYTDDALAWALYRNGRFAEARGAIDRALAHGTKDARLIFHRGAILIALGARAEGAACLREALHLNPKFDVSGADEASKLLAGALAVR
jgi:tetratricopeptide (TPR) repeat protein